VRNKRDLSCVKFTVKLADEGNIVSEDVLFSNLNHAVHERE